MTRNELIEPGQKIVSAKETEEELDKLYKLFCDNVLHPDGDGLFFYPENYTAGKDNLSRYNPTVEEVVDKCLRYKPILL